MRISFSPSLSGIKSTITRQDISAHDIANINTKGFEESTAHQTEAKPRGTRISHITKTPNRSGEMSNTDLAKESVEQIRNKQNLKANVRVAKTQDEMLGDVIDLLA